MANCRKFQSTAVHAAPGEHQRHGFVVIEGALGRDRARSLERRSVCALDEQLDIGTDLRDMTLADEARRVCHGGIHPFRADYFAAPQHEP